MREPRAAESGENSRGTRDQPSGSRRPPRCAPVEGLDVMRDYSLSHLSDQTLLRDLEAALASDRTTTAVLLAHLAEVDARKLYLPAAYPSMFAFCVHELGVSEDAAYKRIRAARTARQCPAIFAAVADGRLHLSAVVMLTPHLTPQNAEELIGAAARRTKSELEQLLAQHFPQPELPGQVRAICDPPAPALLPGQLAPEPVGAPIGQLAPGQVEAVAPRAKVAPIARQRFALQLTIGQSTYDKLQYAQGLLSHQIPVGEIAAVLDRALDSLIHELEKRKFAAASRPRPDLGRSTVGKRQIPADVRRTVWKRDGGQCTFVSDTGHRCQARSRLEFDHVDPVARGGLATVENVRLRCRAHNQYEAERTFGAGFMREKREQAQRGAAADRSRTAAREQAKDVMTALRELGFGVEQARRATSFCETLAGVTLEERVRAALRFLCPKTRTHERNHTSLVAPGPIPGV
ncbi:MAG TPA: hypothetical protein VEY91_10190 [Candidatus Limnocylindria bacterium]|nr:hypothetical protein [Candidatus Limnocylindria bacterium]